MKYRKIPELRRNIYYDKSEFVNFWKLRVTSAEAKYFICRWMVCKSCSIVLNLVVNYHLVVYPQQGHIRIIVSHLCVNIIALHITLLFAFSCAKRWIIFISYIICNEEQKYRHYKQFYVTTSSFIAKILTMFFQM